MPEPQIRAAGAPKPPGRAVCALGGQLAGWVAAGPAVTMNGQRVDGQRVGQQVEVLAFVADRVGSSEPERVVDGAVDALRVVASAVHPLEVRIARGDGPDVLGPVE